MKLSQKERIRQHLEWARAVHAYKECWVSGIYRVVSYRKGEYLAFYIVDGQKNWGDFVSKPPDGGLDGNYYWSTLESAKAACEEHAAKHDPKPSTVARAAELFDKMEVIDDEPRSKATQQSLPL